MSYAPFTEGGPPPTGAPYELISSPPESPTPGFSGAPREEGLGVADAMLVYAHPDDEILFAGGLMLAYPQWRWHLVCVTDPGREAHHEAAQDLLLAEGVNIVEYDNLGFTDQYISRSGYRASIFRNIEALDHSYKPDIVFTHNYRGEYGHHCHVWTHTATHLACENVWDFLSPCWRVKQLRKTLVREVPTDARKVHIFREAYRDVAAGLEKHAPWITDYQLGGNPEFFTQGVVGL